MTAARLIDDSGSGTKRPVRLVVAAIVLVLTGAAFCAAATVLIYGALVSAPAVTQLFATVATVLIAVAVLHFVVVRGIWARRAWALVLGSFISFAATAISGYILVRPADAL